MAQTAAPRLSQILDLIECVDEDSSNYLLLREAKKLLREDLRKSTDVA
ncbi:hypothetical protein PBI_DRMANHATTAN_48 [Arthrobacter phage DrManhattan]|uniref:Uncharacterized protein n=2 Tax=Manhattanvirus drmanhattan TaxID=2734250 RepID=A0A3G2KFK5_9CAUD|nr:hypothetical protein HOU48_gp48 [Arthrobacter phage DrManhattan]AYN57768.1 hypothetical protein PBI_DRMANHATTAN_48 [Arthrobacter phage DrManhattan]QHB36631.1 hypothetical protein SEA_ADOLIN_49 [Arthrobacter phage Adolin]